jgi:hypothetical protein
VEVFGFEDLDDHIAVRSLAFKWIRIIFRCWKDGKPYDEEAYMETLRRRGSPLVGALALATSTEWKNHRRISETLFKNHLTE